MAREGYFKVETIMEGCQEEVVWMGLRSQMDCEDMEGQSEGAVGPAVPCQIALPVSMVSWQVLWLKMDQEQVRNSSVPHICLRILEPCGAGRELLVWPCTLYCSCGVGAGAAPRATEAAWWGPRLGGVS